MWLAEKINMDASQGCKVRAVVVENRLAGWCGIQHEHETFEIALVLDDEYWGLGTNIFPELMGWAKDLGHKTVFLHLLHTRPKYGFLQKMAIYIDENEISGSRFTSYELAVGKTGSESN